MIAQRRQSCRKAAAHCQPIHERHLLLLAWAAFAAMHFGREWHLADMTTVFGDVRLRG
jgi:hypothetical protein